MQLRFNTRAQLVEALKARRGWAEAHDAAQAAEHRAAENEVIKKFRDECRVFGKLNLIQLKSAMESLDRHSLNTSLPSCPMSAVTMLADALAALAITKQEKFTLNGDYKDVIYRAHWLLTASDEPRKATVCA